MFSLFFNLDLKTINKTKQNHRRSYYHSQYYRQLSIISYNYYANTDKPYIRIFKNGRPNLTYSEYCYRGKPYISLS